MKKYIGLPGCKDLGNEILEVFISGSIFNGDKWCMSEHDMIVKT